MILRAIQTFIKDPKPEASAEQVMPGLNVLEGVVRLDEPIRSPVRGVPCAAFFYRSFLFIPGRGPESPPGMHKIRQTEDYAPFTLEMEGGTVAVVPAKAAMFTQQDHRDLQARYGAKFQGVEEVVLPGAKVRVRGKVKVQDGLKVLTLKELTVLEKQVAPQGMSGNRKKRKKGGK